MSSWFDAKQFTSLAKNALTEAQKTLDKALDIKEDGSSSSSEARAKVPPLESANNDDDDNDDAASVASSASSAAAAAIANSKLWGSFTGSFFDASQIKNQDKQEGRELTYFIDVLYNHYFKQVPRRSSYLRRPL